MKVLKLVIELTYDPFLWHGDENDTEARDWFFKEVLSDKHDLLLHSNGVGDTIGTVKIIDIEDAK